MIEKKSLEHYLRTIFKRSRVVEFERLGSGVHGTGFSLELDTEDGVRDYVIKEITHHDLGHDYPSDRAGVFLLALNEYGNLPHHVRAVDVLSLMPDGSIRSIGGGKEYFLLMERIQGKNYFADLETFRTKHTLDAKDKEKIQSMTEYLARIHSVKKKSRTLYWRKIRDTIGHGECLMGVFDTYPDGTIANHTITEIEKRCIDWRARLKPLYHRLSQIHGDFHPGNIWFTNNTFTLLDRSRGPWGDPADDVTALTINYIFFSIRHNGDIRGAYRDALILFFREYLKRTHDSELLKVCGLFFAFRGAVVANPLFYPEITPQQRQKIFTFIERVLSEDAFDVEDANRYLSA